MNGTEYRRGYREGWLLAINTLHDLVRKEGKSFEEAYEQCYKYRQKLHNWVMMHPGYAKMPPSLNEP